MRVLVLGADGFIGRHILIALSRAGHQVLAHARNPRRLAAMGYQTLAADLADPACHSATFWQPHLAGAAVVNVAGLLTGSAAQFRAVHETALRAVLAARDRAMPAIHISAIGIAADTPFGRWRRVSEQVAGDAGAIILRPGLVLGDTSYGGSSALRAFAALPWVMPVIGRGAQPFNPIHAADLAAVVAEVLANPLPPATPFDIGGAETLSLTELTASLRRWLGLERARVWHMPQGLAALAGRMGDLLRLGPISTTALAQLQQGVLADPAPLLSRITTRPRGFSQFMADRLPGTQDLWQARLYLVKPLLRLVLAVMWIASGVLGLTLAAGQFLPDLALPAPLAVVLARAGGLADLGLGLLLLRNLWPRQVAQAQLVLVLAYTIGLTLVAPQLWLDPYGGVLKNLPVLALILTHLALIEER